MQKPTLGRIVLVPMDPKTNNGAAVAPAVITRVWSDSTVNVRVLADGDYTVWRTSSTFAEDLESLDQAHLNYWTWPPRI